MMRLHRSLRLGVPAAAVAIVALAASGCGETLGADTKCTKFITLSPGDQETAIKSLLKDKGQSDGAGSVLVARGSAQAFCRTVGTDKTIEGIYGG